MILFIPSLYICVLVAYLRIWLLYYDINLTKFLLQRAWLSAIDPATDSKNWFNKHHHTLGNSTFLLKYGILLVVLCAISSAVLRIFNFLWIDRILNWFTVTFIAIVAGIIWFKLRQFYADSLGIKKEMVYIVRIGCVFATIFICLIGLFYFKYLNEIMYNLCWRYQISALCTSAMFVFAIMPKISMRNRRAKIKATRNKNENENNDTSNSHGIRKSGICGCLGCFDELPMLKLTQSMRTSTVTVSENFGAVWTDVVCTQFGYETLMDHLKTEFSVENLLFISEVS